MCDQQRLRPACAYSRMAGTAVRQASDLLSDTLSTALCGPLQSLRSACAYAQSDQSLCWLLEYSMSVRLLTEQHLEFLSLEGGCTGSSESTLVKMPHCWKSYVAVQFYFFVICSLKSTIDKLATCKI